MLFAEIPRLRMLARLAKDRYACPMLIQILETTIINSLNPTVKTALDQLQLVDPTYILWMSKMIPEARIEFERINQCARKAPWAALVYTPNKLYLKVMNECAMRLPKDALRFAGEYLEDIALQQCVLKHPKEALKYVSDRLMKDKLDWCARYNPLECLSIKKVSDRVTLKRLILCARNHPRAAVKYSPERLPEEVLRQCKNKLLSMKIKGAYCRPV